MLLLQIGHFASSRLFSPSFLISSQLFFFLIRQKIKLIAHDNIIKIDF